MKDFDDTIIDWAHHLHESGWGKRSHPSLRFVGHDDPYDETLDRTHGTIIESKYGPQYSLFMDSPSNGTTLEDFIPILERHPLLAIGSGLRISKDPTPHLSKYDFEFLTKFEVGILIGYTNHRCKPPLTKLWCTRLGAPLYVDSLERPILCNLLANLANFALPFPNIFKDRSIVQTLGPINTKWAKIVTRNLTQSGTSAVQICVSAVASSGSPTRSGSGIEQPQQRQEQRERQRQEREQQREQQRQEQEFQQQFEHQEPLDREQPLAPLQQPHDEQRQQKALEQQLQQEHEQEQPQQQPQPQQAQREQAGFQALGQQQLPPRPSKELASEDSERCN